MKNTNKQYIIALLAVLLSACGGEDANKSMGGPTVAPAQSLRVNSLSNAASLNWVSPFPNDETTRVSIYLNNVVIHESDNITNYTIINLKPNTSYSGKISTTNVATKQTHTFDFNFQTQINLPPAIFAAQINAVGSEFVELSWAKSIDPEGEAVSYEIYVDNKQVGSTAATNYKVTGLRSGTPYLVRVSAIDSELSAQNVSIGFTTMISTGSVSENRQIAFQNITREYSLVSPANPTLKKMPLVINLHGAGGRVTKEINNAGTALTDIAQREGFYLLMPQATMVNDFGSSYSLWNADSKLPPSSPEYAGIKSLFGGVMTDDVAFIEAVLDEVLQLKEVDLERIYVTGMSSGGYMAYAVMGALQDRIAAVAPIAGLITRRSFPFYSLHRPVPLLHIHGTADAIVGVDRQDSVPLDQLLSFWISNNKAVTTPIITQLPNLSTTDNSTVTKLEYSGLTPAGDVIYYRVNNGNHSVPGGEDYANKDIKAFEIIWAFFKQHKLSDPY